jgi:hypothetical protein
MASESPIAIPATPAGAFLFVAPNINTDIAGMHRLYPPWTMQNTLMAGR